MNDDAIRRLLAAASEPARRRSARQEWVIRTAAACREAQRAMDDKCTEAVEWMDEAAFERLVDAEQAKVDALRQPLQDAAEHDKWPRELHWGGI